MGVLTTRLFGLKAGDALRFKGPYGKFFFDNPSKEDIVLIGAGTGITPLMSIARYCVEKSLPNAVRLLYSVRTPEAIVYRKELEERKRQNPHFDYSVTVTRPEESAERWHGKTGRVDEKMLAELVANPDNSVAFICGPKEFVFSVIGMLERIGVGKERIKTDVWG
ncbi:MAG: oxidoreductase FAD-binding protein [archaeon GW2011_AR11]|nr:MAG: oxidoreductase FAD-binding protein [archaeon GW2011_AR11]